jgi:hypothetical protein
MNEDRNESANPMPSERGASERERLDRALVGRGQQAIREIVQALPEDVPSLEWRSHLNERLIATSQERRRVRPSWLWRPAAGLAVAGALAAVVLWKAPEDPAFAADFGIEASLLHAHREVSIHSDVAGVGLRSYESTRHVPYQPEADVWLDFELGDL